LPSNKRTNGSGVKIGPKVTRTGWIWEQGKPYKLSGLRSRKPQGGQWLRGYRVTEPGRSEGSPVMGEIGVQTLLRSERRLTSNGGGSW